jgi:hypothetical protein
MTLQFPAVGPVERAAHRIGLALVDWSDRRSIRTVRVVASRSEAQRAYTAATALEARHRSWDRRAATSPRYW